MESQLYRPALMLDPYFDNTVKQTNKGLDPYLYKGHRNKFQ